MSRATKAATPSKRVRKPKQAVQPDTAIPNDHMSQMPEPSEGQRQAAMRNQAESARKGVALSVFSASIGSNHSQIRDPQQLDQLIKDSFAAADAFIAYADKGN